MALGIDCSCPPIIVGLLICSPLSKLTLLIFIYILTWRPTNISGVRLYVRESSSENTWTISFRNVTYLFRSTVQLFSTDNDNKAVEFSGNLRFFSAMEQIKQQIARENINFVRFEATDLHGVSRSKTVPVRFFHVMSSYYSLLYLFGGIYV